MSSNTHKNRITQCFDQCIDTYDQWADIQVTVANRVAEHLETLATPQRILEIGCGTGLLSRQIITRFPNTELLLTDIAPAMVKHCYQQFAKEPIHIARMDGEALAVQPLFDLIVSSTTLQWFSHLSESMKSIYAQLTPKGNFIFALLGKQSLAQWRLACQELNILAPSSFLPAVEELQAIHPDLKISVESIEQPYHNAKKFLQTLKNIGATATPHHQPTLSAGTLRKIMRHLDKKFPHGFNMTYEVIYGHWRKPE